MDHEKIKEIMKYLLYVIIVIIVIYIIYKTVTGYNIIVEYPRDAKDLMTVSNSKTPFYSEDKGVAFTQSLWIYVNDWNYRYREEKIIFQKGEFHLILANSNNNLLLKIPTSNTSVAGKTAQIVFENIPIQKWIHIGVVLDNSYVDLWINGKLYHSKHLGYIPRLSNKQMEYTPTGGFSGYISRVYHFDHKLTELHIKRLFLQGPININPIKRILYYIYRLLSGSDRKNAVKCFASAS